MGDKYKRLKKQYSYDGIKWYDVSPLEYRAGDLIEQNSSDCSEFEPQYKYMVVNGYICNGYDKYEKLMQYKTDDGITWSETGVVKEGELIEGKSLDCGYTGVESEGYWIFAYSGQKPYMNDTFIMLLKQTVNGNYYYSVEGSGSKLSFNENTDLIHVDYADTSNLTTMKKMFYNCYNMKTADLSGWNTSKVTSMEQMFRYCTKLTSVDVTNFNTSKVTDMSYMFSRCNSLTSLDLSNFDTSNVTTMMDMFSFCINLISLDLSGWDISKVSDMDYMFSDCYNLASLDLSGWDTSNKTESNMTLMFSDCTSLSQIKMIGCNNSTVSLIQECLQMLGLLDKVTIIQ